MMRRQLPYLSPVQRPVIVIPGFGVSRLVDRGTGRFVWGTPRNTVITRYEDDLDLPPWMSERPSRDRLAPQGFVGSRGPINTAWQLTAGLTKFGGYSSGGRDDPEAVHGFAWDWRLPLEEAAGELRELILDVRKRSGKQEIDIVAHSAGGLVALTWLRTDPAAAEMVNNLVLIGVPEQGTVDALRVFVRRERFVRREFHPAMLFTWPSLAQLLPFDGSGAVIDESGMAIDLHTLEGWDRAGLLDGIDGQTRKSWDSALQNARSWRQMMTSPLPPEIQVTRIAGDCVPTAAAALRRRDGSWVFRPAQLAAREERWRTILFTPGDGTVPVVSAVSGDRSALLLCDGHQGLASSPHVHRALVRTLRAGSAE